MAVHGESDGTGRAQVARNAASSYAVRGLLAVSALFLTPYLFRRLGLEGFGTWSVLFTLWTILELVETGFTAGVVKRVAEYRGLGDRDALQRVFGVGLLLTSLLGFISLGLAALAGWLLAGLAPEHLRDDFRWGLVAIGAGMALRAPGAACAAALKGYQRYDLYNVTQSVVVGGLILGSVVAVEAGTSVLGIAVALGVSLALGGALAAVLLRRVDPQLSFRPHGDADARTKLLGFSSFALFADSMVFVGQRMDVLIVAAVRNTATAAPYAAALKLQSAVQALTLPFVGLVMPMVSELWARDERDEVLRRLTLATRVALQLTLPVAIGIALFASDIIGLWLGPGAPSVTASIVVLLMVVQITALTTAPAEKVLLGIGRVRLLGGLALVDGIANVLLTVVFVSAYGAIGAALGTLLTTAVLTPLRLPLTARALDASVVAILRGSVLPAIVASLPALAAMVIVRAALDEGAARAALGLTLGVGLAAAIGARQLAAAGQLGRVRRIFAKAGDGGGAVPSDIPGEVRPVTKP